MSIETKLHHLIHNECMSPYRAVVVNFTNYQSSEILMRLQYILITRYQTINYLKSLLENECLRTVSGFVLTNVNYYKGIEISHTVMSQFL